MGGKNAAMAKVAPLVPLPVSTLTPPTIILRDMEEELSDVGEDSGGSR